MRLKKRVAVLGGSTTDDIVSVLELFLLDMGFECEFYQSEYGQFWQDAVFSNEELDRLYAAQESLIPIGVKQIFTHLSSPGS